MNRYKVVKVMGGYVIHCLDEFKQFSHAINLIFENEDEAEMFARILQDETQEAFHSGQASTI